jgi:hypothetical protein
LGPANNCHPARSLPPTVIAGRQDRTLKPGEIQGDTKIKARQDATSHGAGSRMQATKTLGPSPCQHLGASVRQASPHHCSKLMCEALARPSKQAQLTEHRETAHPIPTNRLKAARLLEQKQRAGKTLTGKVQHKWKPLKGLTNLSAVPGSTKCSATPGHACHPTGFAGLSAAQHTVHLETPTLDPGNPNPLA